ncbi:MAG: hypothetical protein WC238_01845 [Parcubacteria group bacterium]|jgi:hypothetical protein
MDTNTNIQEDNDHGALFHWRAPEYEIMEKSQHWYLYAGLFLAAVIAYAVYTNSPVMAITFILVGVVGYIFINKEPRVVDFYITHDGIISGREIYEFDNVKSFWIFYEPGQVKVISLHTKNKLIPFIHIPVHDEDPVKIREILLEYIQEVKQVPSAVDTFERMLGI